MCKAMQVVRHAISVACGATFGSFVASGVDRVGAKGTVGAPEAVGARHCTRQGFAVGARYCARQGFACVR
eukprot:4142862-Pleurochrysis_carterae.AAC.1